MSTTDYPGISPKVAKGRKRCREALDKAKRKAREEGRKIYDPSLPPIPPPEFILVEEVDVRSNEFLKTYAWRTVRYKAIRDGGNRCECCGAAPHHGVRLNVDHILPRKKRPDLALDPYNLQVLCDDCNAGKGNWDETDWR